jgi:hypothetical protein
MSLGRIHESNQGHQAKMNSSDWSGLESQNSEDGWTQVLSKSSKKMLRKKQRVIKNKQRKGEDPTATSERCSRSNSRSRGRSRSLVARSSSEDELREEPAPLMEDQSAVQQRAVDETISSAIQDGAADESVSTNKPVKRSRSASKAPGPRIVPETPEVPKNAKVRVIRVNAADGKTLDECVADAIKSGKYPERRDVDPSSQPPAPSSVRQVAEMLINDPSTVPQFELGVPSTRRREAALKRLRRILGVKYLEAEKLLTCSALTHERGRENYRHALELGRYLKHGASLEDGGEAHRVYLRGQVRKLGYTAAQADLAIQELEASLGLLNISAADVQGWLVRQAVAYNQAHLNSGSQPDALRSCDLGGGLKRPMPSVSEQQEFLSKVRGAHNLLQSHGMSDAAAGLIQAVQDMALSSKVTGAATGAVFAPSPTFSVFGNLQKNDQEKDPFWDKPPTVKLFLLARQALWEKMQQVSAIPAAQLLRVFDIQIASRPTFLEAVQHFPGACGVKCELSAILQRHIEGAQVCIRDLELGSRLFLADMLERSTDLIMRGLEGNYSRKLVEAEFVRAFKRCGDRNQAVQSVSQTLKAPSVPTPSWRVTVGEDHNTPRSLGANYRLGQRELPGMSARRKSAGHETARKAALQEIGAESPAPPAESRYQNPDAIRTLRKMLKEDPELSNLPAEQQLRVAARRVSRRIDFSEVPPRESLAKKRDASQREGDSEDEETDSAPPDAKRVLQAKRSAALADPGDGTDDGSSASSSSSPNQSDGNSDEDSVGAEHDSDEEGSACDSDEGDSRESDEEYVSDDGFVVRDDDAGEDSAVATKKAKSPAKKVKKSSSGAEKAAELVASQRDANVNSLGTPKKSEGTSSVSQGGNIYFGEDELKKWTTGSEKYKQGFNWPAYIHHKQNYDNYCQFKGVHAARTFKPVIHAKLVPALCSFCGLKRLKWKTYEDATVILAIEKTLRPSKSTDFALELKQIQIADDKGLSLMQNCTCFFENFSCKVAEAEDASRAIKPNVVKSTFKTAISGYEILKLWLEEVPWRGLDKANARLLRKLREVRSWEQLQRKGLTSSAKKRRTDDVEVEEARPRSEGRKTFRGTRAGKALAIKRRAIPFRRNNLARSNFGSAGSSDKKRFPSKSQDGDRRKHPGLDKRGENWHDNKELFECFHTPCEAPFCQRCGRHGHNASSCRIPDDAPGINLSGYYQEQKKGKARLAGPPPRDNAGRGKDSDEYHENSGKNNAQRGSGRACLH